MNTSTSIGPGSDRGGNEDHGNADGLGNKTLGDHATQQPPAGADSVGEAGAQVPAGGPGARPRPGIAKAPLSDPDGPDVEASPREAEAARGHPPKKEG